MHSLVRLSRGGWELLLRGWERDTTGASDAAAAREWIHVKILTDPAQPSNDQSLIV